MSIVFSSGNYASRVRNAATDPGAADWSEGFFMKMPTVLSATSTWLLSVNATNTPGYRLGVYGDTYGTVALRRRLFGFVNGGVANCNANAADPAAIGDNNWRLVAMQRRSGEFQIWVGVLGGSVVKLTNSNTPGSFPAQAFSGISTNYGDRFYGADRNGNSVSSGAVISKPWILIGSSFTEANLNQILTQVDPLDVTAGPVLTSYVPLSSNTDIAATEGGYPIVLTGTPANDDDPWTPGGGAAARVWPTSVVSNGGGFARSSDGATTDLQTMIADATPNTGTWIEGNGEVTMQLGAMLAPGSDNAVSTIYIRKV